MGAANESVKYKLEQEKDYLEKIKKQYNEEDLLMSKLYELKKSTPNYHISYSLTFKPSKDKNNNKPKKYNLNILYYDEHLRNDEENSDNCSFIEMNTNGTFYGCHNFELFKIVCEKLIKSKKEFILLSSGSCAEKIYDYCSNMNEIREYYIYCFLKEKYMPLMNKYPKLKGVYNIFSDLKEKLYTIKEIKMNNINSSNLIFFEDYSRIYIKLHYEFIRKYSLYKLLKSKNCNEFQFLKLVEEKYPYFLDLAKQLFPDKNETIDYFIKNADESKNKIKEVFECDDNILDDNIKSYIQNYSQESFYYKYLNKFLREGNFDAFRTLSSHIAKFIFKLYDFREKNHNQQKCSKLYRKMYLNPNDIKLYKQSIGRVICYPSFTSTSKGKDNYTPTKYEPNTELVLLIIEKQYNKSAISISEFSEFPEEEEYLFVPFSFFKILKVELNEGSFSDPHIIHLFALNSDEPVEDMFYNFIKNETDNLNPEGLDFLLLTSRSTKIIFNDVYLTKKNYDSIL